MFGGFGRSRIRPWFSGPVVICVCLGALVLNVIVYAVTQDDPPRDEESSKRVYSMPSPGADPWKPVVISPSDGDFSLAFTCPGGQHLSGFIAGRCYSDRDYVIRTVTRQQRKVADEIPVAYSQCLVRTTGTLRLTVGAFRAELDTSDQPASIPSSEVEGLGRVAAQKITSWLVPDGESAGAETVNRFALLDFAKSAEDPVLCPEGSTLDDEWIAVQYYDVYSFDLDVINTRTGATIGQIPGNTATVWLPEIAWVPDV